MATTFDGLAAQCAVRVSESKTWLGYKDVNFQNDESGKSSQRFHSGGGRKSMKMHSAIFFTSQRALLQTKKATRDHHSQLMITLERWIDAINIQLQLRFWVLATGTKEL